MSRLEKKINHKLEPVEKVKLLDVSIEHKMKLQRHVNYIANKVSHSIGGLHGAKYILSQFVAIKKNSKTFVAQVMTQSQHKF